MALITASSSARWGDGADHAQELPEGLHPRDAPVEAARRHPAFRRGHAGPARDAGRPRGDGPGPYRHPRVHLLAPAARRIQDLSHRQGGIGRAGPGLPHAGIHRALLLRVPRGVGRPPHRGQLQRPAREAQHPRSHDAHPLAVQRLHARQRPALGGRLRHLPLRGDPRPREGGLPPLPPRRGTSLRLAHQRPRLGQHPRGGRLPCADGDHRARRLEHRQVQPRLRRAGGDRRQA